MVVEVSAGILPMMAVDKAYVLKLPFSVYRFSLDYKSNQQDSQQINLIKY